MPVHEPEVLAALRAKGHGELPPRQEAQKQAEPGGAGWYVLCEAGFVVQGATRGVFWIVEPLRGVIIPFVDGDRARRFAEHVALHVPMHVWAEYRKRQNDAAS